MSTVLSLPQSQTRRLVADLTALGDRLEAENNPLWINAARAAAALEGLRLGVTVIEPLTPVPEVRLHD